MILLDTHIWIWWIDENPKLSPQNLEIIEANLANGLGISMISCWEIASLSVRCNIASLVSIGVITMWVSSSSTNPLVYDIVFHMCIRTQIRTHICTDEGCFWREASKIQEFC